MLKHIYYLIYRVCFSWSLWTRALWTRALLFFHLFFFVNGFGFWFFFFFCFCFGRTTTKKKQQWQRQIWEHQISCCTHTHTYICICIYVCARKLVLNKNEALSFLGTGIKSTTMSNTSMDWQGVRFSVID